LIIARSVGESILIDGNLRVTLLKIQGETVEFGFEDMRNKINFPNLTTKEDQRVQIAKGVNILVVKIRGKQIRLGIDIPPDIKVLRGELAR
jgi:sRNA-binding carbon storage regulator CsrA